MNSSSLIPPAKRQKTPSGYNSTSTSTNNTGAYNSDDDDGDDLLGDFIPDTPSNGYQTQATQILTRPTLLKSSPPATPSSVVQVPASSPLAAKESEFKSIHNGGKAAQQDRYMPTSNIAMSMAPAGTSFRPPAGIVTQLSPSKKASDIITIPDDEDGSLFQGGSSDDELGLDLANINPTKFVSKSVNSSFGNFGNKNGSGSTDGNSKFKAIVANSAYQGSSKKRPLMQTRPERAQPVTDVGVNSVADENIKKKIVHFRAVLPNVSVLVAQNILVAHKGNLQEAIDSYMAQQDPGPIVIDDDDFDRLKKTVRPEPQMKRGITQPLKSFRDKYSSTQSMSKQPVASQTPQKPKRKLMQGRRNPSSPGNPSSPAIPQAPPVITLDDEELGDYDSGVGSNEDEEKQEDTAVADKILKYLNTCSVKELVDTTSFGVNEIQMMVDSRPFNSLNAARNVENTKTTKSGKKSNRAPIGDKIVQRCIDMFEGYEAISTLENKCMELGIPVAAEMKGWGFDVFGSSKDGEIEITSLDEEAIRDSGLGSPSSMNNGDEDIKTRPVQRKKRTGFLKKPSLMAVDCELKDYQVVGLNWLALMYRHQLSCILADDMGLGKTCQVISFLTHLVETGHTGPHLVVCPGSTLENWLREFRKFSPNLHIEPYHGSQNERREMALEYLENRGNIHVVVTTYDMACKKEDNNFLRRLRPDVCVYDEGHMLKNVQSQRYQYLMKIAAGFRLLLTGTPLQNNLRELVALLAFILPDVFAMLSDTLNFIFKAKATTQDTDHAALLSKQRIDRARSILTPFVLRRKKEQVLKHLPEKTHKVVYATLHEAQKEIYDGHIDKARERFQARIEGANIPKSDENNPLMQLRKAAIHPLLFRRHFTEAKIDKMANILRRNVPDSFPSSQKFEHLVNEMRGASDFWLHTWCELYPCIKKFDIPALAWMDSGKVEVMMKLVKEYKENGDRVLIFSQFALVLDILEAVLNTSAVQYIRIDGSTKIEERQTLIDTFRDDENITAFLLTTKAGGTGINLMYANKVIIVDSSFNPQDDKQAENRAHRVGQTRKVEVVRLVTKGTIEEQIMALGQTKLELDGRVAGEEDEARANEAGEKAVGRAFLEMCSKPQEDKPDNAAEATESKPEKPKMKLKLTSRKKSILDTLAGGEESSKGSRSKKATSKPITIDDDEVE